MDNNELVVPFLSFFFFFFFIFHVAKMAVMIFTWLSLLPLGYFLEAELLSYRACATLIYWKHAQIIFNTELLIMINKEE